MRSMRRRSLPEDPEIILGIMELGFFDSNRTAEGQLPVPARPPVAFGSL